MKVQELSAGDVFYTCQASNKKVQYGPYILESRAPLAHDWLIVYKAIRVVDRGTSYLPGSMECIKVGSISNEVR